MVYPCEYSRWSYGGDYLAHYGVPGQKWGVRRYLNPDGTFTAEGLARYRAEHPKEYNKYINGAQNPRARVRSTSSKRPASSRTSKEQSTIKADKKNKIGKILAIAGGVTLAAIAGYALHKHLGKVVNRRQQEILDVLNKSQMPTVAKEWTPEQRMQWKQLLAKQANERASEVTRGSVVRDKLHMTRRADVLRDRRRSYEVGHFVRKANNQAEVRRQIDAARKDLARMQESMNRPGLNEGLKTMYQRNAIDQAKRIEELLEKAKKLAG